MDNFNSLFPSQQDYNDNDEHQLLYPPANYTNNSLLNYYHHQDTTSQLEDLVTKDLPPFGSLLEVDGTISLDSSNNITINKKGKNKLEKSPSSVASLQVHEKNSTVDKKIIHKEIERQRRQEMSNLYASLRQLLPLEYLKGKRSTSDHILETVNYIEHLQKKVRNLEDNRDKLKKGLISKDISNCLKSGCSSSTSDSSKTIMKVRPCLDGIEILINLSLMNEGFCLSRVLDVLIQEGLTIVNCSCNKVNGRLLHSIRTEVCSPTMSIDSYKLQQKLAATFQTDVTLLD